MKPYKWVSREEMLKNGFTIDVGEDAPDYGSKKPDAGPDGEPPAATTPKGEGA